jgi:ADP-ribose pyrophosphatase YjhB (NUDIX family)
MRLHRKGDVMRVRVSAVFERGGEILCMKYFHGGKEVFALPGGGVDQDVPFKEALLREWKDELGVKVDIGEVILIGEASAKKRHPQTLHIIFEALEIYGTPKIRPDNTTSLGIEWVAVEKVKQYAIYPDVGKYLDDYLNTEKRPSLPFIDNCMERGFW